MENNNYDLNELNLDDLGNVAGGRYMNPEEQNQLKALLMDVSRIRADLIAKNRYKDACQIVSEYNAISDAFRAAVANSPEGSATFKLSDFVGNTLSKYGL